MHLDWSISRRGDATLVECRVVNDDDDPRRVRVASRLDGPVWAPRDETGWDADGFAGEVPGGGTLALGYASPAPPADPPVALVRDEPTDGEPTPEQVIADLGDPRPPRDAVGDG